MSPGQRARRIVCGLVLDKEPVVVHALDGFG
jgi:hypothetical protein